MHNAVPHTDRPAPDRPPASRTPAIIGFLVAGAAILGLGFLAGLRRDAGPPADGIPELRILDPGHGDSVTNPVTVRFATSADLRLGRAGWAAGDLHLHAMADGVEIMPAAADVTVGDGDFAWQLPALPAGDRRLYLTWAGRDHRNIAGPTDTVTIHILP
ncbi:MAG TPA: hypothetical protein VK936_11110 [Longimicrobiales bacterium]|nr:hypothetical protein [Longimicrobiales bacterium]